MIKKIFVVILNYNGYKNTLECIHSFENIEVPEGHKLELLIVDNASSDDSAKNIKKVYPQIHVLENKKNLGYSGGNNVGISYVLAHQADYIVVLNNDTLVTKNFLVELLEGLLIYRADIACPKIYFEKGFEYHKDRYAKDDLGKVFWFAGAIMDWKNVLGLHRGVDEVDTGQFDKDIEIEGITGACFLAKREVFQKVGLFDDNFFLYYEDADFSFRVKKAGFKIILAPKSMIYHKNAGSTGGSGSKLQDYFITRNRLIFGLRYAPLRSKLALVRESVRILLNGREWQKKGVFDFYLKKFGKGSFPLS